MKSKIFKNVNYAGFTLIILAFLFIYFSYFFIYIPREETKIQQKGFRILKEYGSNMEDKYKYFENQFKNFGIYYSIRCLEDSGIISKIASNRIDSRKSSDIENVINGLPEYIVTTTAKSAKDTTFFQKNKAGKMLLVFCKKNIDPELTDTLKNYYKSNTTEKIDEILKTGYSNSVPIDWFLNGLKYDELFETIIFFDSSNVWYSANSANITDITNPDALCDSVSKKQGGMFKTLNVRGKDKHAMVVPINLAGEDFYLAGFITDVDYRNKTRAINKQLLIYVVGLLLLLFAGMPILKIIFIDARERLKAGDASKSAVSLLFGIGLFILLVVAFSKEQFVDHATHNRRIRIISEILKKNVTSDLNSLKALGNSISTGKKTKYSYLADSVCNVFYSPGPFYQDTSLKCPFPLNEIILINNKGIVKKGYTRTAFSDVVKVDLSERLYFKNIKNIENSWPDSAGQNYYIESIKSLNTGAVETAMSFYATNFDSLHVLAITSEIPSLYRQVLPKDIEFVIINQAGKVLYHSQPEKNLHENFILECESDAKLIKAINNQSEENIKINYNEKKWMARVVPIGNTPLFHITLLDLTQAGNKNARIFLFTFYFFIATVIFILLGLVVTRWITIAQKRHKKNRWFLNWIVFRPHNYLLYKKLTTVLTLIIIVQLAGYFIAVHPVGKFLYQLIFIVYTLFVSMFFLNRKGPETKMPFYREFFTELNVLLVTVLLILFFLWKFESRLVFYIPMAILLIITVFIYSYLKKLRRRSSYSFQPGKITQPKLKRSYLSFLFLWLASISAVPVTVYYFSVKTYEESLWKQEQLQKIALENIELQSAFSNHNEAWYIRTSGNGIDFIDISYSTGYSYSESFNNRSVAKSDFAGKIFNSLPDLITNWNEKPRLMNIDNSVSSKFANDTLHYKKGFEKGGIIVRHTKPVWYFTPANYVVLVFFIVASIAGIVWLLLRYLASVLLNLNQEKLVFPGVTWAALIKENTRKRILLNTYDGNCYLQKSFDIVKTASNRRIKIKPVLVSDIVSTAFKIESLPSDPSNIIWISGFSRIFFEPEKHEKLLSVLISINQDNLSRIILDMPFELTLVNEFYDDYIATGNLDSGKQAHIFLLRKMWKNVLDSYYVYNGFLSQNLSNKNEIRRREDSFRMGCESNTPIQFNHIWENLTFREKIVLFDLADDGLLNRKNKIMIQELIDKRLVIPEPYPAFFSSGFREYALKNIKPEDVKLIQSKLGLKGTWHNAKYMILLILIPLTAFIIISQGISVEKVFGIFAGGLAIITGVLRLTDGNAFKQ